jgi:hypothetical protein
VVFDWLVDAKSPGPTTARQRVHRARLAEFAEELLDPVHVRHYFVIVDSEQPLHLGRMLVLSHEKHDFNFQLG